MMEYDDRVPEIIRLIKAFYRCRSHIWETDKTFRNKNWCSSRLLYFPYNIRLCNRLDNGYRLSAFMKCANLSRSVSQVLNTLCNCRHVAKTGQAICIALAIYRFPSESIEKVGDEKKTIKKYFRTLV